jgi:hypothetical protein
MKVVKELMAGLGILCQSGLEHIEPLALREHISL